MTTLRVQDLESSSATLEQDFTVVKRLQFQTIQMNLIFVNAPAGTFTLNLKQGSDVIATTGETYASLSTKHSLSGDPTHHGFFNFDFTNPVVINPNTTYTLELTSSGYTFSESGPASFVSWVKPYTDLVTSFSEATTSDDQKPFGFKIWSFQDA